MCIKSPNLVTLPIAITKTRAVCNQSVIVFLCHQIAQTSMFYILLSDLIRRKDSNPIVRLQREFHVHCAIDKCQN